MISVIVPVFNLESYIENCLKSLVKQTYRDIEILVVNDGSTDKSAEIIQAYCANDSRITHIFKQNGGVSSARNCGLEHAIGEYIAFVDGDDYVAPDYLEFLLDNMKDDAVLSMCKAVDPPLQVPDYEFPSERIASKSYSATNCAKWLLQGRFYPRVWGALFKRDRINQLEFAEANNGEDKLFLYEFLLRNAGKSVAFTNTALYGYFSRPGSATKQVWKGSRDAVLIAEAMFSLTERYMPEELNAAQSGRLMARFALMKQIILSGDRSEFASSLYRDMSKEARNMSLPENAGRRLRIEYTMIKLGDPLFKALVFMYYSLYNDGKRHKENERRKIQL